MQWIGNLSWGLVIILCLTLGLAPFSPPHIVEKIRMLVHGELKKPIDRFDLFLHGIPWGLLVLKGIASFKGK
ncbi:MAG TPA: RND transporter [Nitrospirae bacterium]|nr:RND transporter [Nitrospirota bacterium]HDO22342.1 RND transporter [Nitrospirota bacterium]HDZ87378.1 RND transporter [Nitrospirota bacterium]